MAIEFRLFGEAPPDPPRWCDFVAIGFAAVCTLVILASIWLLRRRRNWPPIAALHVPFSVVMLTCEVVHLWGVVVSNDHFPTLSAVTRSACVGTAYWMQMFLGLGGFLATFSVILTTYSIAFQDDANALNRRRVRCRVTSRVGVIALILLPCLCICSIGTALRAAYIDPHLGVCTSKPWLKISTVAWILWSCTVMSITARYAGKFLRPEFYNHYQVATEIAVLGIGTVFVNGFEVFFGLLSNAYVRSFNTLLVCGFHMFVVARLYATPLWMAWKFDEDYLGEFARTQRRIRATIHSIRLLRHIPAIMKDFLMFCAARGGVYKWYLHGKEKVVYASNTVAAYESIQAWKRAYPTQTDEERKKAYCKIYDTYISDTGISSVACEDTHLVTDLYVAPPTPSSLREFEEAMFERLDVHWGTDYLKELPTRTVMKDRDVSNAAISVERHEAIERQKRLGLTDGRIEGIYEFGAEELEDLRPPSEIEVIIETTAEKGIQ
jgi:hypothetical protein